MYLEGKIEHITEVEHVGQNATPKVTICIRSNEEAEYLPSVAADLLGDKVDMYLMDYKIGVGDTVKLYFSLGYTKVERKDGNGSNFYNQIRCWKIETIEKAAPGAPDTVSAKAQGDDPF